MDFKDTIQQIVEKIAKQKDSIATEEATKNSFVMPVIAALGYDVFNPFEVVPEMDCDLVKRKGEKNRLCHNEGRKSYTTYRMQAL